MSDLISREEVIDDILKLAKEPSVQRNPDSVNGLLGAYNIVYEKPSADIMECARAIKEYCKDRTNKPIWYNDCPLYEPFCKINTPPNMWDLPEGEKEPPVFIDSAPLKDCKNTAESYGEICVKCNKAESGE